VPFSFVVCRVLGRSISSFRTWLTPRTEGITIRGSSASMGGSPERHREWVLATRVIRQIGVARLWRRMVQAVRSTPQSRAWKCAHSMTLNQSRMRRFGGRRCSSGRRLHRTVGRSFGELLSTASVSNSARETALVSSLTQPKRRGGFWPLRGVPRYERRAGDGDRSHQG